MPPHPLALSTSPTHTSHVPLPVSAGVYHGTTQAKGDTSAMIALQVRHALPLAGPLDGSLSRPLTPPALFGQPAINFNGGGHINHSIFWTNLAPQSAGGGEDPTGDMMAAIDRDFGSLDAFKTKFAASTVAVQGSGWGWLGLNKEKGSLEIATTANQDPLTAKTGLVPLLGVDVWEHAYYLQYKNVRPDYLKAIWEVVDWKNVTERYNDAKA